MAIKQISVFLENKKGSVADVTRLLRVKEINLRSICVADTRDYGILRLISDEPEQTLEILKQAGHTCKMREVCSVAVPDEAGALSKVLELLDEAGINMEYFYSLPIKSDGKILFVIRLDDNERAEALFRAHAIEIVNDGR